MTIFDSMAALIGAIAALLAALTTLIAQIAALLKDRKVNPGKGKQGESNPGEGKPDEGKPGKGHQKAGCPKRILIIGIAVAVLLCAVFILVTRTPPQCKPTTLTITSPSAGAVVDLNQTVTGNASCLSSGQHPWLVLQVGGPGGGGYFPQD